MYNYATTLSRPFLKWPGGKMRLIQELLAHLPDRALLAEPFVGAGALFANTQHKHVFINDINADLINIYQQLKNEKLRFIKAAKLFFSGKYHNAEAYYDLRAEFNASKHPFKRACLFLYLNRHGYNGLCRYNSSGSYNVPFGDYKAPYFPHQELLFFIERLKNASLSNLSYADFMCKLAEKESLKNIVFYCDPPYAPLSKTANFTGYAASKFALEDQKQLALLGRTLYKQGAAVMISNHDLPFTRKLYKPAYIKSILVKRVISCKTDLRQEVKELLAIYT